MWNNRRFSSRTETASALAATRLTGQAAVDAAHTSLIRPVAFVSSKRRNPPARLSIRHSRSCWKNTLNSTTHFAALFLLPAIWRYRRCRSSRRSIETFRLVMLYTGGMANNRCRSTVGSFARCRMTY